MNCIKIITLLVACSVLSAQEDRILSDVILNSSAESYALTFRNGDGSSEGVMEAWLTIAPQAGTDKRVLARITVCPRSIRAIGTRRSLFRIDKAMPRADVQMISIS
jgi:hypothetical protein